jgi:hypothetical protein
MISLPPAKNILLGTAYTLLLLQTSSCITSEREAGTVRDPAATFTPKPARARSRVNENTVLRTVNSSHYFSNPQSKDIFILQLRGPKILSARAHFIILSSTGDTLRAESMPATALLRNQELADPQAATIREKEVAILQSMNAFFRQEHFTKPALPDSATPPTEVDAQAWQAVKEDPGAVGFDYVTSGRERRLAYAPKLRKAVVVAE